MARKIDEDKIERIKHATMQTIVENGIEKTTIAMIAKNANVSDGYLYRLYSGKQALIESLFQDKLKTINNELQFLLALNPSKISAIIKGFIHNRIVFALNEPVSFQFFYHLLHNTNFKIDEDLKKENITIVEKIKQIGTASKEIGENVPLTQIYYHLLLYVVDYIHFKQYNLFINETISEADEIYLTNNILTILKKDYSNAN
ncbi:MAG TPA: TetR/AcrR family transcriptional regulator [Flavobacteriaceae bacterium]|nr:TetR/AcrR family transcriptional regulator [Flavobacteriaceae bacterium]